MAGMGYNLATQRESSVGYYRMRTKLLGGKRHEVPCHHSLDEYLDAWIAAAGIGDDKKGPVFRSFKKGNKLTSNPMIRSDVLCMIKRRAKGAGLPHSTGCHTFRATWLTAYLQTAARWSMHSKSPRTSRHVPPNCTIGPGMRFRWTRLSESNSEGIVPHTKGPQVSAEKIARRECGSLTQRREQSHSRGGRRPTRTRPGSTTVKPSRSRAPSLANASTTPAGFAPRARLVNLTNITPAAECPRA
jgi:hypothetical protein